MEWNWLHSLVFGIVSGFGEFLPVSTDAHQMLFAAFTGAGPEMVGFQLACRVGALLALLLSCRPQLERIRRERRLAAVPIKRRKRQPDQRTLLDVRVLKTAAVPALLALAGYPLLRQHTSRLWLLAPLMALNGLFVYIPRLLRIGNKDSRNMSAVDSFVFGLGGALGCVPGFSRVGCSSAALQLLGGDRQAVLELSLLLCVPVLTVLTVMDAYLMISTGVFTLTYILLYILSAAAAAVSAYFGILLVRFLAVHEGFSGFSYYCWGAAMLSFILYLMI